MNDARTPPLCHRRARWIVFVSVGALGVDTSSNAGFDIYSEVSRSGQTTTTQDLTAWATLEVGGVVGLYDLTPFSGRARLAGTFDVPVIDLAFPLEQ